MRYSKQMILTFQIVADQHKSEDDNAIRNALEITAIRMFPLESYICVASDINYVMADVTIPRMVRDGKRIMKEIDTGWKLPKRGDENV